MYSLESIARNSSVSKGEVYECSGCLAVNWGVLNQNRGSVLVSKQKESVKPCHLKSTFK